MPVDEGFVDTDPARDAVDAGVLCPALVEQRAGRVDDLAADGGAGLSGRGIGEP